MNRVLRAKQGLVPLEDVAAHIERAVRARCCGVRTYIGQIATGIVGAWTEIRRVHGSRRKACGWSRVAGGRIFKIKPRRWVVVRCLVPLVRAGQKYGRSLVPRDGTAVGRRGRTAQERVCTHLGITVSLTVVQPIGKPDQVVPTDEPHRFVRSAG